MIRGNPKEVFPKLFREWNVQALTFESDIEPYALERDSIVESHCKEYKVKVIKKVSHTIYDPELILGQNNGEPILVYQKFLTAAKNLHLLEPIPVPSKLPFTSKPQVDSEELKNPECYKVPSLKDLKIEENSLGPNLYPGGEIEGLHRMEIHLKKTKWICTFEKPKTSPNSLEPSTTVLSPYLKFGCLSSRLLYKKLNDILNKNPGHTQPPVSLVGQLMWREFYYSAAFGTPNFDKMKDNKICLQVPWKLNKDFLDAWTYGRTGYPFIDAIMRQLRQEGWIHHLARHVVACFLTRGDLWISWEEGQKVFEELLLDADWALNAGNWMWLSASAFFHQFFRVYSPVVFGKKTDPTGNYIKKYVPELKNYPAQYIYEPWKATKNMQKSFKCVLGTNDYPNRIIIHEDIYKVNISKMTAAYAKRRSEGISTAAIVSKNKRKAGESSKQVTKSRKLNN